MYLLSRGLLAVFGTLLIITSYYHPDNRRYSRKGSIFYKAIDGIQEMNGVEILITVGISILVGLMVLFIIDRIYDKHPIVVGFEFNEDRETITLATKNPDRNILNRNQLSLKEIAYTEKEKKDGLSKNKYQSIVFIDDLKEIGILFLNHTMWDGVNQSDLEKDLVTIKRIMKS